MKIKELYKLSKEFGFEDKEICFEIDGYDYYITIHDINLNKSILGTDTDSCFTKESVKIKIPQFIVSTIRQDAMTNFAASIDER